MRHLLGFGIWAAAIDVVVAFESGLLWGSGFRCLPQSTDALSANKNCSLHCAVHMMLVSWIPDSLRR